MRRRRVAGAAAALLAAGALAAGATVSSAGSNTVSMGDNFFDPTKIKVGKGDRVTWVNDGQSDHTVKFKGEKDKIVAPGDKTGRKFREEGKFKYGCTLHPEMVGKVIVRS
jgi:plastocyanin